MIELFREYHSDRTLGTMTLENGAEFKTMELPFIENMRLVSCVPEGVYRMIKRPSSIAARTTKGKYTQAWELTNVPGRSDILVHIANFPWELKGCIGIGKAHQMLESKNGPTMAVIKSAIAFDEFMQALSGRDEWYMEIKS